MKNIFKKSLAFVLLGTVTNSMAYADPSGGNPYFKQEIRDSIKILSQCQDSDRYEEIIKNKYGYQHVFIGLDQKPGLLPTTLKVVMAISNIESIDIQKIKEFNSWNSLVCLSTSIQEKIKSTDEIIGYSKEFFGSTYEYTKIDYNPITDSLGAGKIELQKRVNAAMEKYLNLYKQAKAKGSFWINTDYNRFSLNNPYRVTEE